ncbi:methyltransferase domain-containing protein [Candidatus Woesearchaeota archaeon]|nr:methyltransferase domain-containing protein [Candidatus Woesearchaeota archaeon]
MKCLLLLSGENPKLAVGEAAAVLGLKKFTHERRILAFDLKGIMPEDFSRLAYSVSAFSVLFHSSRRDFTSRFRGYKWNNVYSGSFSVRIKDFSRNPLNLSEKELASIIWRKLKNPAVNLENPSTPVVIIATDKGIYCCIIMAELKHDFESRLPKNRPGFSPVSLHPKLARAVVNLTGIRKGIILDPFCGTGGLLIEAGLMGFKPIGFDIDDAMLDKSIANLNQAGIGNFVLVNQDATTIKSRYDFIAADLPYGINSRLSAELNELYSRFLARLRKILGKRAVIVFPDFVDFRKLARNSDLKLVSVYSCYIHKGLTKKIAVLE